VPGLSDREEIRLWGVIASPYLLKMQSLLDYVQVPWQRWPEQGSPWRARLMALRLTLAKKKGSVRRFPSLDRELDEYPSVPFYSLAGGDYYYDSTGLAQHLDQQAPENAPMLVPGEPVLAFLCQLIDEAFDEFGLYMVHHMRWVGSANTTAMGVRTAAEMRHLFPLGLHKLAARQLPRRQVRRCPYLFSVAEEGFDAGVSAQLTPPSRAGFPPTHALLDRAWLAYLQAMEGLLTEQPYLLGDRFTLSDASAYGQLSMNLVDGAASERLRQLAPRTYRWLCDIRDGNHVHSEGELYLSAALNPLLEIISATFLPLMTQNLAAYKQASAAGETLFNEAAFDAGRGLYDGMLLGQPFRAVIKTFQVRVWQDLRASWQTLSPAHRELVAGHLGAAGLENLQSTTEE
jgi:glutathione S-transferase